MFVRLTRGIIATGYGLAWCVAGLTIMGLIWAFPVAGGFLRAMEYPAGASALLLLGGLVLYVVARRRGGSSVSLRSARRNLLTGLGLLASFAGMCLIAWGMSR